MIKHLSLPGQIDGNFYNKLSCSNNAMKAGLVTTDRSAVTCKKCQALVLAKEPVTFDVLETARFFTVLHQLPRFTARVYEALVMGLYAEPGFSDVTSETVADRLGIKQMQVVGALKKLADMKLAQTEAGYRSHTAHSGLQPVIYLAGWQLFEERAAAWKTRTLEILLKELGADSCQNQANRLADKLAEMAEPKSDFELLANAILNPTEEPKSVERAVAETQARDLQGLHRLLSTPAGRAVVAQALTQTLFDISNKSLTVETDGQVKSLGDPQAKHAYDLETDQTSTLLRVYAASREQAIKLAQEAGYEVRSVNMIN